MVMIVGTDATNNTWDPVLTTKFPHSRLTKVFFPPGSGIRPWTGLWYTTLPAGIAPHVCFKDWADDTSASAAVTDFLDNMPPALTAAPLIPELGISMALSWWQEPEDAFTGGAAEFKRRYSVLYPLVKAHPNGHFVAVMACQKYYWTRYVNGGDWSTWFPAGNVDYAAADTYNSTFTGVYEDPDSFLAPLITFRDFAGLPLWLPELGAALVSGDTDGTGRAAWITALMPRIVATGCVAASWWDAPGTVADESLNDTPSIDAWASAIATGGLMAIARRVDGADLHTTSTTSVSVTLGTTPVDGDQLIAVVMSLSTTTPTPPSGWSILSSQTGGANDGSWVYTKTASSETGTYTWTGLGSAKAAAWVGCYSGVDTTAGPSYISTNPASTANVTTPTLPVQDNWWLISVACCRHPTTGSASTWTDSDGSDSARVNFGSSGGSSADIAMALFDSNRPLTAGNVSRTLTSSNTEGQIAAWSIALPLPIPPITALAGYWGVPLP